MSSSIWKDDEILESRPVYYSGDFFQHMDEEKKIFIGGAVLRNFRKNDFIYREGESSNSIYYIDKGSVRLSRTDINGRELSYAINSTGALIGISATLYGKRRLTNARALTDCRIYEMSMDRFKTLIQHYPNLLEKIIEILVKRVSYLLDSYLSILCDSASDRLCKFLAYNYYLALLEMKEKRLVESNPHAINQSELATFLGVSRQRTNELLHNLDNEGIIKVQRNTIIFLNPDYLLNYL